MTHWLDPNQDQQELEPMPRAKKTDPVDRLASIEDPDATTRALVSKGG